MLRGFPNPKNCVHTSERCVVVYVACLLLFIMNDDADDHDDNGHIISLSRVPSTEATNQLL